MKKKKASTSEAARVRDLAQSPAAKSARDVKGGSPLANIARSIHDMQKTIANNLRASRLNGVDEGRRGFPCPTAPASL